MANSKEKLIDRTNEGYINLSKWLITLATGTIVFSIKLIKTSTGESFRSLLALGLGLLFISIILGVRYVRLRLDAMHYEYVYLESRDRLNSLSPDAENDHAKLDKIRQDANRKMNEVSDVVYVLFLWQERLFYMGLVIVGVFGIYSI